MLTVGKLRELIKDVPDDILILKKDPYSEFSFEINIDGEVHYTKIDHITILDEKYYTAFDNDSFNIFLDDNPEDVEEIKKKYKSCLILEIEDEE